MIRARAAHAAALSHALEPISLDGRRCEPTRDHDQRLQDQATVLVDATGLQHDVARVHERRVGLTGDLVADPHGPAVGHVDQHPAGDDGTNLLDT